MRSTGQSDIYLGHKDVGLTNPAYLDMRGMRFLYDDQGFAIGAYGE